MPVALINCKKKSLKRCIKDLFVELNFIPHGKVFIKPNFSAREYSRKSENTDPEFLKVLVHLLLEFKCEVIIGHRANLGTADISFPFKKIIEVSKIESLGELNGVEIVNLDNIATEPKTTDWKMAFQIPRILSEADVYINLAKLKTHMQTQVTLSLKNQMGLLPAEERKGMHKRSHLEKHIACLAKIVKPTISIIEGLVAMEGNGPHHGQDREVNLILGGNDMVELDSFAATIMGFDYKKVKHICFAQEQGVGRYVSDEDIEMNKSQILKFKPPEKFERLGTSLYVWPSDACPGCLKALEVAGKKLKNKPASLLKFLKRCFVKRADLILGNCCNLEIEELKGDKVGFGSCSKMFCQKNGIKHMDGCPLSSDDIKEFILLKI